MHFVIIGQFLWELRIVADKFIGIKISPWERLSDDGTQQKYLSNCPQIRSVQFYAIIYNYCVTGCSSDCIKFSSKIIIAGQPFPPPTSWCHLYFCPTVGHWYLITNTRMTPALPQMLFWNFSKLYYTLGCI